MALRLEASVLGGEPVSEKDVMKKPQASAWSDSRTRYESPKRDLEMKKTLLSLAVVGFTAIAAPAAYAADGTIVFQGMLTNQTCTAVVKGTFAPLASAKLPVVSTGLLQSPGNTAGRIGFMVNLENCAHDGPPAYAFFESSPNADPILDNPIQVGSSDQIFNTTRVFIGKTSAPILPYAVRYFVAGPATAGVVKSQVVYTLVYY
jgi:major type 1 subunit fimbrin (pilin)